MAPSENKPKTSAAGRLLAFIKLANAQSGNVTVFTAWATALRISTTDVPAIHDAVGRLFRLLEEAKADVTRNPELDQELYLGSLKTIEAALSNASAAPNNSWAGFQANFQGAPLHALEFVAENFNRLSDEELISPDALSELTAQLDSVIGEVMGSDLDPALKRVLIEKLEDARRALVFYRLDGADGLRRAVENALGMGLVATQLTNEDATSRAIIARYLQVLDGIFNLVSQVKPYVLLMPPVIHRLLGSG